MTAVVLYILHWCIAMNLQPPFETILMKWRTLIRIFTFWLTAISHTLSYFRILKTRGRFIVYVILMSHKPFYFHFILLPSVYSCWMHRLILEMQNVPYQQTQLSVASLQELEGLVYKFHNSEPLQNKCQILPMQSLVSLQLHASTSLWILSYRLKSSKTNPDINLCKVLPTWKLYSINTCCRTWEAKHPPSVILSMCWSMQNQKATTLFRGFLLWSLY